MNPALGITLKILSSLGFTFMSAAVQVVSTTYPVGQIIFFRSAFALLTLIAWLMWQGEFPSATRTSDLRGHLTRGALGAISMVASFLALAHLPLSEAVAIGYTSPLITVVLAALVLKERVRIYRWSAVGFGFVGIVIILLPHLHAAWSGVTIGQSSAFGATIGLVGACLSSGSMIQTRRLTATESTGAIVFYFSLFTTVCGLATLPFGWVMPGPRDLALLIGIGVIAGVSQTLLTSSYRFGDASLIAPFEYTTMIWALLIGWLAYGNLPGPMVLAGGIIVVGSGAFVVWRERRLGLINAKTLASHPGRST